MITTIHDELTLQAVLAAEPDSLWVLPGFYNARHLDCMLAQLKWADLEDCWQGHGLRRVSFTTDCTMCTRMERDE